MTSAIVCNDDARRDAVRAKPELNGLDYLEVRDDQTTLVVYFLGKAPGTFRKGQQESFAAYKARLKGYWQLQGGRRIRNLIIQDADVTRNDNPEMDDFVTLRVNQSGDFSTYTLRLVGLEGIDPFYDHIEFSFKVDCPNDLDCATDAACPPPQQAEPESNYLARDYASFRQLILDRLALIMPDWQERHVPDIGIALVELLAYTGDHLAYYQDAVATEAYLETARQRVSVRRHARLVDYRLHEGCAARAWLALTTNADEPLEPRDIYFITGARGVTAFDRTILAAEELQSVPVSEYEVFEAVQTEQIQLQVAHNLIYFYTWGQGECCLPRGATRATLVAESEAGKLNLEQGALLLFEEVQGPRTGDPADADYSHRHVVRLTKVTADTDPLNGQAILEIEWAQEDALPFPLCLSAVSDAAHGCICLTNVSVARGNVFLVEHGLTVEPYERLGVVESGTRVQECDCANQPSEVRYLPKRFRPRLAYGNLAFRQPLPSATPAQVPAARWLTQDVRLTLPQVRLESIASLPDQTDAPILWTELADDAELLQVLRDDNFVPEYFAEGVPLARELLDNYRQSKTEVTTAKTKFEPASKSDPAYPRLKDMYEKAVTARDNARAALVRELKRRRTTWKPQPDLLASGPDDSDFVVEVDNEGVAWLRFGNDELGEQPKAGTTFYAQYRIGGGTRGNVGAEAISHLVLRRGILSGLNLTVRNPLPARGGVNPEPLAQAKLLAPTSFRRDLQRAVIAQDYADLAVRDRADLQGAAATLVWTGSWYEADVAIDSLGGTLSPAQLSEIQAAVEPYRRIGHDLRVGAAREVPIELELCIQVAPQYLRGHVQAQLNSIFSSRVLADGSPGMFHPDRLSFGGGIYLSRIIAAAFGVTGVESVQVTKLNRLFEPPNRELENGLLPLGPLEVAQLDNDPNFPEHGRFNMVVKGGR